MSEEMYAEMPEQLTLRMVRAKVDQPGFRVEEIVVVTTLTDAEEYAAGDIRELYHQRWLVELDIRSIKTTMNMEVLKTKTPESCRREVWMHALAYNLARQQGIEAALNRKKRAMPPREKLLDGAQEARLIALSCSKPPKGRGRWTLHLLADRMVELEIVESISHETVRRALKKTN